MSRIFSLYNNKIFLLPFFDRDLLLHRGSTSDFANAQMIHRGLTLFSLVKIAQKYDLIFFLGAC